MSTIECPCGGVRGVCEYHPAVGYAEPCESDSWGPPPDTERVVEAASTPEPLTDEQRAYQYAHDALTRHGFRLLGADDPEVSTDLIYVAPDGGIVSLPRLTVTLTGKVHAVKSRLVCWPAELTATPEERRDAERLACTVKVRL